MRAEYTIRASTSFGSGRALEADVVEFFNEVTDILLVENPWYAEAVRRGRVNWTDDEPPE